MKKNILIVISAAVLFSMVSCSHKKETAASLVPEDYSGWTITADNLNYPIPGHENHFRRVLINPKGQEVSVIKKEGKDYYAYPKGTIVIKEIYPTLNPKEGTKPVSLTVMIKDPENPQSRDGWIWVVKDLKKNTEKIIDYEFCYDCHTNANEPHQYGDGNPDGEFRDYLFFPYRKTASGNRQQSSDNRSY